MGLAPANLGEEALGEEALEGMNDEVGVDVRSIGLTKLAFPRLRMELGWPPSSAEGGGSQESAMNGQPDNWRNPCGSRPYAHL